MGAALCVMWCVALGKRLIFVRPVSSLVWKKSAGLLSAGTFHTGFTIVCVLCQVGVESVLFLL